MNLFKLPPGEQAKVTPRMIVQLRWDETSGVDRAANLTEGWLVMKSAQPEDEESDVCKGEVARLGKGAPSLGDALMTRARRFYER